MDCADAELVLAALFDARPYVEYIGALQRHMVVCNTCRESFAWMMVLDAMEKIARDLLQERGRTRAKTARGRIL